MDNKLSQTFNLLDQATLLIQPALDVSYLEALIENGENIIDGQKVRIVDGQPSETEAQAIQSLYDELRLDLLSAEDIRKIFQWLLLKAMKEDYVQANHMVTPDIVGQYIYFLADLFLPSSPESLHLVDMGCGSGNLLTQLYGLWSASEQSVHADGIEIDDDLLALAVVNAQLQGYEQIQFTRQDVLDNLWIEPADIIVSDLPIGYYPKDQLAERFDLAAKEGPSYSHFLFIEQAFHYLKEGGLGFFILPSSLFAEQSSKNLVQWIQSVGYFQGLIQLPATYFKEADAQQSILFLQKKGPAAKQAREVLIASAPDIHQPQAMQSFLMDISQWKNQNL